MNSALRSCDVAVVTVVAAVQLLLGCLVLATLNYISLLQTASLKLQNGWLKTAVEIN